MIHLKNSENPCNEEYVNEITEDLIKIFTENKDSFTKLECKNLLNIIFESLFDEKLKNKNFNYIYNLINKDNNITINKKDMIPIIKAFIVSFDVNYITNTNSFNDKVCIKIGKHLLPICYYIKKNNE
jgi:hypothetical protein